MIKIKFEDDTFYIKGNINLGYIGNYNNDDFYSSDDDNAIISIDDSYEEIIDGLDDEWEFITNYTQNTDGESIAKAIEDFFNSQEKKVAENIHAINGTFIANIIENFSNTTYPFWEEDDNSFVDMEQLSNFDDLYDIYATEEFGETEDYFLDSFPLDEANDGTIDKPDNIVEMFKMGLPMFNLEKFFSNIDASSIILQGSAMIFSCNDNFGGNILSCAYAEIHEDLSFVDWHNH